MLFFLYFLLSLLFRFFFAKSLSSKVYLAKSADLAGCCSPSSNPQFNNAAAAAAFNTHTQSFIHLPAQQLFISLLSRTLARIAFFRTKYFTCALLLRLFGVVPFTTRKLATSSDEVKKNAKKKKSNSTEEKSEEKNERAPPHRK